MCPSGAGSSDSRTVTIFAQPGRIADVARTYPGIGRWLGPVPRSPPAGFAARPRSFAARLSTLAARDFRRMFATWALVTGRTGKWPRGDQMAESRPTTARSHARGSGRGERGTLWDADQCPHDVLLPVLDAGPFDRQDGETGAGQERDRSKRRKTEAGRQGSRAPPPLTELAAPARRARSTLMPPLRARTRLQSLDSAG